ncbi:hypothetical protein AAFC00_006160 [Neodothiora populina]|uniref:Uncharacterized protein n=1 Tax=Neodothiora populina TaxID=2781224 RepID=A0ABR3P484_9PEZI
MSSANITTGVMPQVDSFGSMAALASCFIWAALEVAISVGLIAGYAHVLCFACSLVLRNEQSLEHSNDPDLPKKEQTASLMLTGFLTGLHLVIIFVALPLAGHDSDSFIMKVVLSCAVLAASTTAAVIGGIMLYLIVPAFYHGARSITRRVTGGSKNGSDIESAAATADAEVKQAFLEKE